MIYGDQAFGSSLLFYLQRPVELVNGNTTSMWFGSTFPDAPRIYLTDADLLQAWSGDRRVFLFVPPHLKAKADDVDVTDLWIADVAGGFGQGGLVIGDYAAGRCAGERAVRSAVRVRLRAGGAV